MIILIMMKSVNKMGKIMLIMIKRVLIKRGKDNAINDEQCL